MIRGERPIKLRDSWFSAKSILVERLNYVLGVEHSLSNGGLATLLSLVKLPNTGT